MKKPTTKHQRVPKASPWQKKVEAFLDREEDIAIREGNDLTIEYLKTCRMALVTCQLLGIKIKRLD